VGTSSQKLLRAWQTWYNYGTSKTLELTNEESPDVVRQLPRFPPPALPPRRLPARRRDDRPGPVLLRHPLPALRHLQPALGLRLDRPDAGLRDLRLRRAPLPAARRAALRRGRPAPGPDRLDVGAGRRDDPLHARRLGDLALRRPRDPGPRHRPRAERRQRRAARPPSETRPGLGQPRQRRRVDDRD